MTHPSCHKPKYSLNYIKVKYPHLVKYVQPHYDVKEPYCHKGKEPYCHKDKDPYCYKDPQCYKGKDPYCYKDSDPYCDYYGPCAKKCKYGYYPRPCKPQRHYHAHTYDLPPFGYPYPGYPYPTPFPSEYYEKPYPKPYYAPYLKPDYPYPFTPSVSRYEDPVYYFPY